MNQRLLTIAAFLVTLLGPAGATTLTRRATITGGGGANGKCTIEVDVDGAAEVEVSGDTGVLRTLSGQTAVWRRFQCNAPMPRDPGDFRFVGVDGRGSVRLLRDPRSNRGKAVVHIDDPKSGREGYTFDLQWRGSGENDWPPPPPQGRGPGRGDAPVERTIRACQDAVTVRLNQDGYPYVTFQSASVDDNPGRNDWVVGKVSGRHRFGTTWFSFSCAVDFRSGTVRSVDLRRR